MGIIRGRVHNDEWTKYDKDGIPTCGVGYRGYWTNHVTVGGRSPFVRCSCGVECSGWKHNETGRHAMQLSWKELCDLVEKEPANETA